MSKLSSNPMQKYEKELRNNLRYAYKHSALNMFGKVKLLELTQSEIGRILSSILETYYPIRPYPPGSYEQITKDEFMSIFRSVFKDEIRRMRSEKNPVSLYQSFHGTSPKRVRKVKFDLPKGRLIALGDLVSVEYAPRKNSRYYGTIFKHKLGDNGRRITDKKPLLCTDSMGENLYLIKDGANTHFTEFGIID